MKFAYMVDESFLCTKQPENLVDKIRFWRLKHCRKVDICKLSDIYDERFVNIGELILISNPDKIQLSDKSKIVGFFIENGIHHVCCAGINFGFSDTSVHFYDGSKYRFERNIEKLASQASSDCEYLLIINNNISLDVICKIAEPLRYLNIFCDDLPFLRKVATFLYEEKGISAGVIYSPTQMLQKHYNVISADSSFSVKYPNIADKVFFTDLFAPTKERQCVFSDVVGEFYLDESYLEYRFMQKNA